MLKVWLHHHARLCGAENLFLILHNPSQDVRDIANFYQHIVVNDAQGDFDIRRMQLINGIANGMLNYADAVLHLDVDEFIVLDSLKGPKNLAEVLQNLPKTLGIFATGVEPFEVEEDKPLVPGVPLLSQRKNAVFTRHYSKPALRTLAGDASLHFVPVLRPEVNDYELIMPEHLYLFHLKYFNSELTLQTTFQRKRYVKSKNPSERYGAFTEWEIAPRRAMNMMKKYRQQAYEPFEKAYSISFGAMAENPIRSRPMQFVRPGIPPEIRFELPEHMQNLIAWPPGLLSPNEYDNG